jgi:2-methylisocitrate lyase-like PEP mutase family enzyme
VEVEWSRGYPDGDAIPPRHLAAAVSDIARVLSVPLTVDIEGGYSNTPFSWWLCRRVCVCPK